MRTRRSLLLLTGAALGSAALAAPALALSRHTITTNAEAALRRLYAESPKARALGRRSRAVLVFANVANAGFLVGAELGNGVLLVRGRPESYYNIASASFGLQAGVQVFSYALFFMTQSSLDYLRRSDGWALGTGPSIAVIDVGIANTINTTTLTHDVYAFPFNQRGLMAAVQIEGSKITHIQPGP